MLSPGQVHALNTRTKVDGSEASPTYMKSVEKTVKLKIYDACEGLHQVYKDFPQFRAQIESSLSWLTGDAKIVPRTIAPKTTKETDTSDWPDDPKAVGTPLVVDRDAAFKDFSFGGD